MKSKIFCFNNTIFKKNLTHFWPIWVMYLCYLLVTLPAAIWISLMNTVSWDYTVEDAQYDTLVGVLGYGTHATPYLLFAILAAMAVFSYLHFSKNANMIHALPVNRNELFLTNYCSGLCMLLVPELIAFVVAVFVCLANQITCMQYLFSWLIYAAGISFFGYSMAVFLTMITGQIFAMPIYFLMENFAYVGVRYIISQIINLICYGITEGWRPGYSGMLSPWYFLETHLSVSYRYSENNTKTIGLSFTGVEYVAIYAALSIIFIVAAWILYRRRQIETAGDVVSVSWVKPIFRWGIALCGGSLVAVFVTMIIRNVRNVSVFISVVICMIVFGFIFFFIAEMLLQKNFKVFSKRKLIEWCAFTCVAIGIFALFRFDVFGVERRVPAVDDVKQAYLFLDYPIEYTGDDIDTVREIHKELIDCKKDYRKLRDHYCYVTIKYELKDGETLVRRYQVPSDETSLEDQECVTNMIYRQELIPENQIKNTFGMNYETNQLVSGNMDIYDDYGNYQNYIMSQKEIEKIYTAYIEDIKDGNLEYQLYSLDSDDVEDYYNNVQITYYNVKGGATSGDYYYNGYYHDTDTSAKTCTAYLSFNADCTNVIQALKDLNIINDDWNLYTYNEFDKLTNDGEKAMMK